MTTTAPVADQLRLVNAPATLWRGTGQDLRDVVASRELLRAFTSRELRTRYKGASLGWAWALVRPLVMLLVYGLAVGVFLGAGRTTPQFMIFVYSGLLAWTLFSTIVMGSINSLVANGSLVSRASFPRLLLPLSVVLAALVDFALQASVLTVGYLIYTDWPSPSALVWLVPSLLVLVLVAMGVGLALAAVNVYVRDVGFLVDVVLQVGFWLTPILYSYSQVLGGAEQLKLSAETVSRIYMLNPMANVVIGFQRALWPAGDTPSAAAAAFPGRLDVRLAVLTVVALIIAWLGMRIFVRLSANFGQEL
ncbi:MAG: transporter permease [Frankiales bacterium]|nr:transporter permease [Frankiales bacterium]